MARSNDAGGHPGAISARRATRGSRPQLRRAIALAAILLLVPRGTPARTGDGKPVIGYLALPPALTPEDSAAVAWLSTNRHLESRVLNLDQTGPGKGLPVLSGIDVLWIHIPDSADYARWRPRLGELTPLKSWYENGGRFLFTGLAAMIPRAIGIESVTPTIEAQDVENDWLFDQKGFQGYRPDIGAYRGSHPLFFGLFGGTFTWDGSTNHRLWTAGFSGDSYPSAGKVVAVEKSYITINAARRLIVEYDNGRGRGVAAGGYLYFQPRNNRRAAMEQVAGNLLRFAAGDSLPGRQSYWTPSDLKPGPFDIPTALLDSLHSRQASAPGSPSKTWIDQASGLLIARDSATRNFFDVASPELLVMGKESGGIDEVWAHPFRLLRDYQAGIVSGDTVIWLNDPAARIEVRPESFTRFHRTPGGALKEIISTTVLRPSAMVRYEYSGTGPVTLVVKFRSDLRLMWPYDSPATGALRHGYDEETGTLVLSDEIGESWGAFGADALPGHTIRGQFDSVWWAGGRFAGGPTEANQVWHAAAYALDGASRSSLTVAMNGGDTPGTVIADLRDNLRDPGKAFREVVTYYSGLLSSRVTVETPDREFNDLFKWALVGTDRFYARSPVGIGFLAGYSTTARGWDGAQKISGRPGYGWYFGRDAVWSGFAVDDYGDFSKVRDQMNLLSRYQDSSGKIFHEISTSGSVHYDASDATPLYVLLGAHLLRASGDTAFIRGQWPNLRRAMEYLYSTDTDGDLLIENTNEGHGWVEGGALYPVHTEFYLAGAWGKALLDAAYIATTLGMDDLADGYRRDGERVKDILNGDFWNPQTNFFNLGKLADGTYNTEPTVLPATVMYYGLLDDAKVKPVLERYAGSGFTSDWGVRIVSSASPLFNPQGYHYGSVWPLFTGWTALAEYEYGNSIQGFTHILNNLYIKNHWALGFVEEVMNGAVYTPSGVCPHQCWSETNILHPAITGMIGWKPDAPSHAAGLYPRFPIHWDTVAVNRLRAGGSELSVKMVRTATRTTYSFQATGGPLTLDFAPEIPEGMSLESAVFTGAGRPGRTITLSPARKRGLLDPPMRVDVHSNATLVITHTGGIGVVPAMPRPEPGDSSAGHRIVSEEMRDGVYEIKVEGRQGASAEIEVRTFDRGLAQVENAAIVGAGRPGFHRLRVDFPAAATPSIAVSVKIRTD